MPLFKILLETKYDDFQKNDAILNMVQKEAIDIPSKSELLMFSIVPGHGALLPGQILCINTHPAKRYVR